MPLLMNFTIHNALDPDVDYRFLELSRADDWPRTDGRIRTLLIAFNVPGYYSLPVRILSLMTALTDEVSMGHDVRYVELDLGEDWSWLPETVERWHPEIVGLSANIWNIQIVLQAVKDLKDRMPHLVTLLGGQEVTGSVDDLLSSSPDIDYVLDGEGEIPFLQFLLAWDRNFGKLDAPSRVSGLQYRDSGSVVFTGPSQIVDDLDRLPSPVLAGLVPVGTKNKLGVMLEGARGCPYQCSFCFEGSRVIKVRMASLDRLSAEANYMADRGATYFHLMDPILCNSKPERLKGIAELFQDLNRKHKLQISLETYAQHINDQIAPYLSEFTILDVGLQSTNPATLKEIRRSFSMERFREGLASLRKVNPNFNLYLICGLPHETLLTFLQGIEFVLGERPVRMFINELCLLNGTELRRRAADYGYQFNATPPYRVFASAWMDRFEMRMANTFSSVLYRQFNSSIRALFPLAPWVRHAPPSTGNAVALDLRAAAGADLKGTAGADVEVIVPDAPAMQQTRRIFGQLQLMGASRLKVTSPVQAFADSDTVEQLVALGVLQFKTFLAAGDGGKLPGVPEGLQHITRTFSVKGYASLKPFSEVVVLPMGDDPGAYRATVDGAIHGPAELVSIPASVAERGASWTREMAACFRAAVDHGKWLRVPPAIAREAIAGIRDRDAVLEHLQRLGLLSGEPDAPPYR